MAPESQKCHSAVHIGYSFFFFSFFAAFTSLLIFSCAPSGPVRRHPAGGATPSYRHIGFALTARVSASVSSGFYSLHAKNHPKVKFSQ